MSELRFESLDDFARFDEPGADPLVRAIAGGTAIPTGGLIVIYGDGGTGKTTLTVDVLFHLAAGLDWCGVLATARPLRALLIENEGPRPMMRDKLRAKLDQWDGSTSGISVLADPWSRFTFRLEEQRDELVQAIDEHDSDLVVVGPVSRIGMEGAGTFADIDAFLELVRDVQTRAARPPGILLVHHTNRAGQVSGAWEPFPDTLVHVQGAGHGHTRVYWQKARWSSELHATTTRLAWADGETFTVEEREEITEDTIADALLTAARELPGGSWTKIRDRVKGKATDVARVRDRLIDARLLVNGAAREDRFNLWCSDDPAAPRSLLGTAWERPAFPFPDGEPEPSPFPVPVYRERENGNGPGGPGAERPGTDELAATVVDEREFR